MGDTVMYMEALGPSPVVDLRYLFTISKKNIMIFSNALSQYTHFTLVPLINIQPTSF